MRAAPLTATPELDQFFADTAKRHLGIATLETRRGDRLDFHNDAVWAFRDALRAAWEAGVAAGHTTHLAAS